MVMHNPPHPGEFIEGVYLEPFALSIRQVAERLGVSASTFQRLAAALHVGVWQLVHLRRRWRRRSLSSSRCNGSVGELELRDQVLVEAPGLLGLAMHQT